MALYTEGAMPLHKVTCIPRGHALGVVSDIDIIPVGWVAHTTRRQVNCPRMTVIP